MEFDGVRFTEYGVRRRGLRRGLFPGAGESAVGFREAILRNTLYSIRRLPTYLCCRKADCSRRVLREGYNWYLWFILSFLQFFIPTVCIRT